VQALHSKNMWLCQSLSRSWSRTAWTWSWSWSNKLSQINSLSLRFLVLFTLLTLKFFTCRPLLLFSHFHHQMTMRLLPDVSTRFSLVYWSLVVHRCWKCIIHISMISFTLSVHFFGCLPCFLLRWKNNVILWLATIHFLSLKNVRIKAVFVPRYSVNQGSCRMLRTVSFLNLSRLVTLNGPFITRSFLLAEFQNI